MAANIDEENDFDKSTVTLKVSEVLGEALAELAAMSDDLLASDHSGADFARFELAALDIVREYGRQLVSKAAGNRDDGTGSIERGGRSWYRAKSSRGTLTCLFGRVEYQRSVYRNSTVRNSICPTDEGLGLLAGRMTVPAGRIATRLLAEMPVRTARDVFDGFVGESPAVSTWQKLSRMVDWSWRTVSEKALEDIRIGEDIPESASSVVLSLDGVYVLLRPGEHPIGIAGDDDDGRKGNWREASCGTVTFLDGDGDPLHTISSGWMPEHLKGTLKKWLSDEFEAIMRKRPDLTSVGAADGARDNWSFLSGLEVTEEIVDFYHATTYLSDASEHAASKDSWYGKWRSILLEEDNGVDRVIGAIRGLYNRARDEGSREELRVICNYFNERRGRMQYADLKRRGLPIGSGHVEAANKTHVEERMKRSGMRWSMAGGQAILGIRSLVRSGRFDRSWDYIVEELKRRDPANDNWNPWKEKRKAA